MQSNIVEKVVEKMHQDNDAYCINKIKADDEIKIDRISGATLYLSVMRSSDGRKFKRTHRREHIKDIFKMFEIKKLQVSEFSKEALLEALKEKGINLTEKEHKIKIVGPVATIEMATDSFIAYGKAELRLTKG